MKDRTGQKPFTATKNRQREKKPIVYTGNRPTKTFFQQIVDICGENIERFGLREASELELMTSLWFQMREGYHEFSFRAGTINVSSKLLRIIQNMGKAAGVPVVISSDC